MMHKQVHVRMQHLLGWYAQSFGDILLCLTSVCSCHMASLSAPAVWEGIMGSRQPAVLPWEDTQRTQILHTLGLAVTFCICVYTAVQLRYCELERIALGGHHGIAPARSSAAGDCECGALWGGAQGAP